MIRRREFIVGLGSAAAWPMVARAQSRAVPVIGVLVTQSADDYKTEIAAFLQGLKETGYVDGQNVAVEYRWAENQMDRLPALAADLVRRHVAVIVAFGSTATLPAKSATTTIPIVFFTGSEIPDYRHRRLLRPRHRRPRRRAPEPRNGLPPPDHWITSSAVANSVSGMVRPRALAVLRLMTNSNLVGCWTGRSAGFSPLRMRPV